MHDVDPLGRDQFLEHAGIAPERERIDGVVRERNPFGAVGAQLRDQRTLGGRDQRAGAGLQQRVGDVERGAGTGSSRKAGTICNMVAPASVRGERCVSSKPPLMRHPAGWRDCTLPACRGERATGALAFRDGMRRNTAGKVPAEWTLSSSRHANGRLLPEILAGWNRRRGPIDRRAGAPGRRARAVVARRLQVRHAGDQGAGPRRLGGASRAAP